MIRDKALFLDRDGVINVYRPYVCSRQEFEFQDGIFELCSAAQEMGFKLFVVTNQSGIARGYYTEEQFLELTNWMVDQFVQREIEITRVYYCPYHPDGVGQYRRESEDRKPKPGLLLRAKMDYNLDMGASVLIGDKVLDMQAASAAEVPTRILLNKEIPNVDRATLEFYSSDSLHDIRSRFFSTRHLEWNTVSNS